MMKAVVSFVLVLLLAACGDDSLEGAADALTAGDYASGLATLQKRLAATPQDPTLNTMALHAQLHVCRTEPCFTPGHPAQAELANYIQYAGQQPVTLGAGEKIHAPSLLSAFAADIAALPEQPQPLLVMLELLQNHPSQLTYQEALYSHLSDVLGDMQPEIIEQNITAILASSALPEASRFFLDTLYGLAFADDARLRNGMIALRSRQATAHLPPSALGALVPAGYLYQLRKTPRTAGEKYLLGFTDWLHDFGWDTLISEPAKEAMAYTWRTWGGRADIQADFANRAGGLQADGFVPVQLYRTRVQLILDPQQEADWSAFLDTAQAYILASNDTRLLAPPLAQGNVPASVREQVTNRMLDILEALAQNQIDIAPLLDLVSLETANNPQKVRLEKIVAQALSQAAERQDYPTILALSKAKPHIAQERKQLIIPAMVDALRKAFRADNFPDVERYGTFLTQDLTVDFNIETIVLEELNKAMDQSNLLGELYADTPQYVLQPSSTVQLDLGPKFRYVQQALSNQPEVIDGILKTLVLNAGGKYGAATAVYRLGYLFDPKIFPPAEQAQYFNTSLMQSLQRETSLSAAEYAEIGTQLQALHPGLNLPFVIDETLNRIRTLEDMRGLWQSAPADFLTALQTVRPEFSGFMQAIDAFVAGELATAAERFHQLTNSDYLTEAKPFLEEYTKIRQHFSGVFLPERLVGAERALIQIIATPRHSTETPTADLLAMDLVLTTRIHSEVAVAQHQLSSSYGASRQLRIPGVLNVKQQRITIPSEAWRQAQLPGELRQQLAPITALQIQHTPDGATLIPHTNAGAQHTRFLRVSQQIGHQSTVVQFAPQQQFQITAQADATSELADVLPIGSLLTLQTVLNQAIAPQIGDQTFLKVFPVHGVLRHPRAPTQTFPIEGVFNPDLLTTTISFAYPLASGGTSPVVARCHAVNQQLQCGLHHRFNTRAKYQHLVYGVATMRDVTAAGATDGTSSPTAADVQDAIRATTAPLFGAPEEDATPADTP